MLKVLVVDDEYLVRKGIITTINWDNYGFEIVDEAEDGVMGYEKFLMHKPDILITDVKMPCMNGIELIKKIILSDNEDCEFLILSGYNDFEYVKSAVEYGAKDYLLKPIQNNQLIDSMVKIKHTIEEKRHFKKRFLNLDAKVEYLTNEFILKLVNGAINNHEIESKLKFYDLFPKYKNYFIIHITTKYPSVLKSINFNNTYLIKCQNNQNDFIFIIFLQDINDYNRIINEYISEYSNANVGISDICDSLEKIPEIYKHANQALDNSNNTDNVSIYVEETDEKNDDLLVERTLEIVKSKYSMQISIKEVAEQLNISASHLMHILKKKTGKTFGEHLMKYRMEEAIKLICLQRHKIYEICNIVGYKDNKYFRKIFKDYTGCSPTEYVDKKI